jgi:hypothetical protein
MIARLILVGLIILGLSVLALLPALWVVQINARLDAQAETVAWVLSQQPPEVAQPTMVVIIREGKQGWKLEGVEE